MIYCVVPEPLADQLYDKLVEHYKDDPNVTVIVDRRQGPDRRSQSSGEPGKRKLRDRRRRRAPGTFPSVDPPSS